MPDRILAHGWVSGHHTCRSMYAVSGSSPFPRIQDVLRWRSLGILLTVEIPAFTRQCIDFFLTEWTNRRRICGASGSSQCAKSGRVMPVMFPVREEDLTMVSRQTIGCGVLGLCALLQSCASGSHDRKYSIAIESDGSDKTPPCTVVLKSEVDRVIEALRMKDGSAGASWTVRDFQIEIEQQLHRTVKQLACFLDDKTPLSDGSVKWLASYAYEATDPDQEIRRFEEYLNSRKLAKELIDRVPVVADERAGEAEGIVVSEGACDRRSQWFGNPETPDERTCLTRLRPLYKVLTYKNEKDLYGDQKERDTDLIDGLLIRVKEARADRSRNVRFLVLGYEIPWDEDHTLIRYGMRFYFIDTFDLEASAKDERATTTEYLGYELDYANEATPLPILAHSMKDGVFEASRDLYKNKQE